VDAEIQKLNDLVTAAKRVVFFGGAGVSTESGIPDFRSEGGLYSQKFAYPPEYMLSRSFFNEHTEDFFEFYRAKMLPPSSCKPNAAHLYLAGLEKRGILSAVVTQNIDGLHQAAGSRCVLELHGSLARNYCVGCGKRFALDEFLKGFADPEWIPRCSCGGIIRPDVTLYGEMLDEPTYSAAMQKIRAADLLIIGGTSLQVHPAAGFIHCRKPSAKLAVINLSSTHCDARADLVIREKIGRVFGAV